MSRDFLFLHFCLQYVVDVHLQLLLLLVKKVQENNKIK